MGSSRTSTKQHIEQNLSLSYLAGDKIKGGDHHFLLGVADAAWLAGPFDALDGGKREFADDVVDHLSVEPGDERVDARAVCVHRMGLGGTGQNQFSRSRAER